MQRRANRSLFKLSVLFWIQAAATTFLPVNILADNVVSAAQQHIDPQQIECTPYLLLGETEEGEPDYKEWVCESNEDEEPSGASIDYSLVGIEQNFFDEQGIESGMDTIVVSSAIRTREEGAEIHQIAHKTQLRNVVKNSLNVFSNKNAFGLTDDNSSALTQSIVGIGDAIKKIINQDPYTISVQEGAKIEVNKGKSRRRLAKKKGVSKLLVVRVRAFDYTGPTRDVLASNVFGFPDPDGKIEMYNPVSRQKGFTYLFLTMSLKCPLCRQY